MTYFKKPTFRKGIPLEKVDLGALEKADPMPKFTVLVKNTFMTK